jgi:hypothetical protein
VPRDVSSQQQRTSSHLYQKDVFKDLAMRSCLRHCTAGSHAGKVGLPILASDGAPLLGCFCVLSGGETQNDAYILMHDQGMSLEAVAESVVFLVPHHHHYYF